MYAEGPPPPMMAAARHGLHAHCGRRLLEDIGRPCRPSTVIGLDVCTLIRHHLAPAWPRLGRGPVGDSLSTKNRVLWAVQILQNGRVFGYVYHVGTGLVTTIVDCTSGN